MKAIDATGAGDTFDGAFLSEWLRSDDPFAAAEYANAAAALSTTNYGAVDSIPNRDDVATLFRKDKALLILLKKIMSLPIQTVPHWRT